MTGGSERCRVAMARRLRRKRRIRIDLGGPLDVGLELLASRAYDLVGVFYEPGLPERFTQACCVHRVSPLLVIFSNDLRQRRSELGRALARDNLPSAVVVGSASDRHDLIELIINCRNSGS